MARPKRIRQPKAPKELSVFDSIYIHERNPYGYCVNISHPLIKPLYDDFVRSNPLPSQQDRYWFEGVVTIWYHSDEIQALVGNRDKNSLLAKIDEILKT